MRKLFYLPMILLLVFVVAGCKLPASVFDGLDKGIYYAKEAEEVCSPLLDIAIEQLEKRLVDLEDPKEIEKYTKRINRLKEVRANLPRFIRNLEQLRTLLEAFNGMSGVILEEAEPFIPNSD